MVSGMTIFDSHIVRLAAIRRIPKSVKKHVPLVMAKGLGHGHWHVPSCITRSIVLVKRVVDTPIQRTTADDRGHG
jgi:hypothetical protein